MDPSFPNSPFTFASISEERGPSKTGDILQDSGALIADEYDYGWNHSWPSHLVVFQALLDTRCSFSRAETILQRNGETIGDLLRSKGYREEARLWNSLWHEDERRRGDVVLLKWSGTSDI